MMNCCVVSLSLSFYICLIFIEIQFEFLYFSICYIQMVVCGVPHQVWLPINKLRNTQKLKAICPARRRSKI